MTETFRLIERSRAITWHRTGGKSHRVTVRAEYACELPWDDIGLPIASQQPRIDHAGLSPDIRTKAGWREAMAITRRAAEASDDV